MEREYEPSDWELTNKFYKTVNQEFALQRAEEQLRAWEWRKENVEFGKELAEENIAFWKRRISILKGL